MESRSGHTEPTSSGIGQERRATTRFALTFELSYTVSGRSVKTGVGRTIDLSSAGMSFIADRPLENRQKVDVSIDWPVLLDGAVRLQLIISGTVVRTDGTTTALEIRRHEFKTRRLELKRVPSKESAG